MNDKTLKALDKALTKLEKGQNRVGGRVPRSAFTLVLGLLLGHQLLVKLVPGVWSSVISPSTWARLAPWQRAIWHLAERLYGRDPMIFMGIGAIFLMSVAAGYKSKSIRFVIWLAAVAVILVNVAVLYTTYRLSLGAAAGGQL